MKQTEETILAASRHQYSFNRFQSHPWEIQTTEYDSKHYFNKIEIKSNVWILLIKRVLQSVKYIVNAVANFRAVPSGGVSNGRSRLGYRHQHLSCNKKKKQQQQKQQ